MSSASASQLLKTFPSHFFWIFYSVTFRVIAKVSLLFLIIKKISNTHFIIYIVNLDIKIYALSTNETPNRDNKNYNCVFCKQLSATLPLYKN